MDADKNFNQTPKLLVWSGWMIIILGVLMIPLGIIEAIIQYFKSENGFWAGLYNLYDNLGAAIGICGFGVAVSHGKRWHLFALLIIVFFGTFLIGLFSMVGRETNAGYYIWAIGGAVSLFILLTMMICWNELKDG